MGYHYHLRQSLRLVGLAFASTCALACNDDAPRPDADPDAGVTGGGFALCSIAVTPSGLTGVLSRVSSVAEGTADISDAIELGGTPTCATGLGAVFTATDESPVLTRYDVDATGQLAESGSVSFANEGLAIIGGTPSRSFVFLSDTRALFIDRQGIVVEWNPTEMTVTYSFALDGLDGLDAEGEQVSVRAVRTIPGQERSDILLYVRYTRDNLFTQRSALVSLRTDTGEFTIDTDERCGGLFSDVQTSDGTIYLASAPHVSTYGELGVGSDHRSCIMRVASGATTFDDNYLVEMNQLTGLPTGGLLPAGGDAAMVLAYDSSVRDSTGFVMPTDFTNASAWRVHRIADLTATGAGDTSAAVIPDFPLQTGRVTELFEADGQRYLLQVGALFSSSSFLDVTDVDRTESGLTLNGAVVVGGGPL